MTMITGAPKPIPETDLTVLTTFSKSMILFFLPLLNNILKILISALNQSGMNIQIKNSEFEEPFPSRSNKKYIKYLFVEEIIITNSDLNILKELCEIKGMQIIMASERKQPDFWLHAA